MFKNKFGLYPWFVEHGEEMICKDDLESFIALMPYGKVFECVGENEKYITIAYGKNKYRVKSELFTEIKKPLFLIGNTVLVANDETKKAEIRDINWHYNKKTPIYYIKMEGKKNSKQYFDEDLIYIDKTESL